MNEKELLCRMALPLLPGIGLVGARHLIQAAGSATMLFEHARELPALLPGVTPKVATAFQHTEVFRLCEAELSFAQKHQIQCLTEDDEAYPSRLRECPDAPLVLFYKGSANLNSRHILSIVGTRNATDYGKGLCQRFMQELSTLIPDVLIVSGLAYGIDIHAHREALTHGFDTVGVLAHGLDRIYPAVHRRTATEMLTQGGLLTEFMSGTNPDRQNFVKRNRIVAGISDATLVVESRPQRRLPHYRRDSRKLPARLLRLSGPRRRHLLHRLQPADTKKPRCLDTERGRCGKSHELGPCAHFPSGSPAPAVPGADTRRRTSHHPFTEASRRDTNQYVGSGKQHRHQPHDQPAV